MKRYWPGISRPPIFAVTVKATVYFSDPVRKTAGYLDAAGKTHTVYENGEVASPSGLALSPDQAMLIVSDAQSRFSWSFQIAPDGSLINGEPFYRLEMPETGSMSGVEGVTEDTNGQVYFATSVGIQVCEANGRVSAILNPPEPGAVSSVTFAGHGMDWLYITEDGKLFRRPVKVSGAKV